MEPMSDTYTSDSLWYTVRITPFLVAAWITSSASALVHVKGFSTTTAKSI
jgi:hypothetical protein